MARDEALNRVRAAAQDASSDDDLVDSEWNSPMSDEGSYPHDEQTLDELHSTQLGEMYESRRRNAS